MKISNKSVIKFLHLIILLISLEYVIPAFIITGHHTSDQTMIQASPHGLPFSLFFPEKAEQKEENEKEGKDRFLTAKLTDFSKLAILLSNAHSHRAGFSPCEQENYSLSGLLKLHCVLII